MNLCGLVLDYLRTLQSQGVQRLAVDDEARGILRGWMLAARRGYQPAPAAAAKPAVSPMSRNPHPRLRNWLRT